MDREIGNMIPLIGLIFDKQMAVETVPTINTGRFSNITNLSFNGTSVGNTSAPDWTGILYESFYTYTDVFPYFFLLVFAIPFIMLYASTGSLKMPGIVGMIISLLAFAFLPASITYFAVICMVISFVSLIVGVFKP